MGRHDKYDAPAHVDDRKHYDGHAEQKHDDHSSLQAGQDDKAIRREVGLGRSRGWKHSWALEAENNLTLKNWYLKWKGTQKKFTSIFLEFLSVARKLGGQRPD